MTFDGSKKERDADSAQAAYTTVATPPVPRTEGFKELNKLFVMYKNDNNNVTYYFISIM